MSLRKFFQGLTGWRQAAVINTALLYSVALLFIGFLVAAFQASSHSKRYFKFFTGDCDTVGRLDLGLHLLLNTFSTAVLASSNFFMQILNAPSRKEIDFWHSKGAGNFLHIGVSSWRNALRVSKWKTVAWFVLLASSIPIHLLFNSAIFSTDYREGRYELVLASEDFAHGAPFFMPGASLSSGFDKGWDDGLYSGFPMLCRIDRLPAPGCQLDASKYTDPSKPQLQKLSSIAANASTWVKLDREACLKEYGTCRGLQHYRHLVVVVKKPHNMSWARNSIWPDLGPDASHLWEPVVPADRDNSLWFWKRCMMEQDRGPDAWNLCRNDCNLIMGLPLPTSNPKYGSSALTEGWTSDFFNYSSHQYCVEEWEVDRRKGYVPPSCTWPWRNKSTPPDAGSRVDLRVELSFEYCLAEPITRQCNYVLSTLLLLVVTLCILVKALACSIVLAVMGRETPLVTIGDAIESFITFPGDVGNESERYHVSSNVQLQDKPRRGYSALTRGDRISSLFLLVLGTAAALVFTYTGGKGVIESRSLSDLFSGHNHDSGLLTGQGPMRGPRKNWDYSRQREGSPFDAITSTLVVNSAQLFLSLWYLHYNQLATQLVMAREWAKLSTASFKPLRVTTPRGHQVSTYFLGLPYRYSIPLFIISIILHWILSRAIYVFFGEGDYFRDHSLERRLQSLSGLIPNTNLYDPSLPEGTSPEIRFSNSTLLLVVGICIFMWLVLVGLSFRKLPGSSYMPIVGTNSSLIAAACRISPISSAEPEGSDENTSGNTTSKTATNVTTTEIVVASYDGQIRKAEESNGLPKGAIRRRKIAQGLLRWGIIPISKEVREGRGEEEREEKKRANSQEVVLMGFGTMSENAREPEKGKHYLLL